LKIPINVPFVGKEEISAVVSILKDGALTSAAYEGGKNVREFEKASSFVKSKYAVAVNSGTAALQAALYAVDIKKGDEVLVPSFTFVATANAVVSTGAKPVFVDILGDNYTMDPKDMEKKISKRTKAVIPVHLYGNVQKNIT
jgi:dTDP-4-amino-4,6-dideoxygalactose transaminase